MKKLLLLVLATAGMLLSAGCLATPAYSPDERHAMIFRNWDYEGKQAVDDWDSFWLFRPASHMTLWNIR